MKLSICIATFNRGQIITETLDSILKDFPSGVELVIFDGNSNNELELIVQPVLNRFANVVYYRAGKNSGVDADYDHAVQKACGEYVWLMTDDDLMIEGAVQKVLNALTSSPYLLIVNSQVFDRTFKNLLVPRFIESQHDQEFQGSELDSVFKLTGACLSFIGGVIIRKSEWLKRDRAHYYGSLFIHVGVIFQKPFEGQIKVLAEPLIKIRYGNAMWTSRGFEIWMLKWPDLVHSFPLISQQSKNAVCSKGAARTLKYLVYYRGLGIYSFSEYKKFLSTRLSFQMRLAALMISLIPHLPIVVLLSFYFGFLNTKNKLGFYDLVIGKGLNSISAWIAEKKVFGEKVWLNRP